jgi:hypothetical protein
VHGLIFLLADSQSRAAACHNRHAAGSPRGCARRPRMQPGAASPARAVNRRLPIECQAVREVGADHCCRHVGGRSQGECCRIQYEISSNLKLCLRDGGTITRGDFEISLRLRGRDLNDSQLQFTENTLSCTEVLGKVAPGITDNYLCTFASAAAAAATPDSVVASIDSRVLVLVLVLV